MNGTEKLEGYSAYSDDEFTSCGLTVKKVTKEDLGKPGVYIKFEIHIFAPPPFLDSYFFPKGDLL